MKNSAFGLDIGATSMKAVWLTQQSAYYIVNACSTAATPARGMMSESALDQEEMSRAITHIVSEAKITTPYVNVALPENQVYTKVIDMPVLSDKELSSAIFWEAEQYIPVPLATITFDYKVLKRPVTPKEGEKMQVLLVGAPKRLIEKYQKILSDAGLTIVAMETEILSAIRSLFYSPSENPNQPLPTAIIINIGALTTSIAIVKSGITVFTYSIPIGGSSISRAIAIDFGFSITQAEEYKKAYGISEKMLEGKIGKASQPILMSILTEVKKALVFYKEKYKETDPITQVILSGGSAKLPGIDLFFAQNCGIETVIANPWKVVGNQQLPPEIVESAPDYSVAIGLAMKET